MTDTVWTALLDVQERLRAAAQEAAPDARWTVAVAPSGHYVEAEAVELVIGAQQRSHAITPSAMVSQVLPIGDDVTETVLRRGIEAVEWVAWTIRPFPARRQACIGT